MRTQEEITINLATNKKNEAHINLALAREPAWSSLLSNIRCLMSRPPSAPTAATLVETDLLLKSDSWYQRVGENLRSLYSASPEVLTTAKPVDTDALLTSGPRLRILFDNLKFLARTQAFD